MSNYIVGIMSYLALYTTLSLSLNLVVGYSGMLSLGHAAFLSLGAYSVAIFTVHLAQANFWLVWLLGGLAAAALAAGLGAVILRLRGDYLAIASLGLAEILRNLFVSARGLTRGARGIFNITGPLIGDTPLAYRRYLLLALCWLLVLICYTSLRLLLRSRLGRAIEAVREDPIAAAASGINPVLYRVIAFSLAGFFAALAGGLWAIKLSAITPNAVGNFGLSVLVLAMVVLGGMGNQLGAVVGAMLLIVLQNALDLVDGIPPQINQIIYGLLLVVMMLYRPQGFFQRQRRLFEVDDGTP